MRQVIVVVLGFFALGGEALAKAPCETQFTEEGSFLMGRRFATHGVVPGVSPADAFKRISVEGMKSGLTISNSDKELGVLSFQQANAGVTNTGQQVNLPWNVTIEEASGGVKVTVSKTTPGGYATSTDFQMRSMCAVIDAARPPG